MQVLKTPVSVRQICCIIKHEYLQTRAYKSLSLSSTSSPVISQIVHYIQLRLSRYSCLHLGSRIQEFYLKIYDLSQWPSFWSFYKKAIRPFIRWKRLPLLSLRLVVAIVVPRFLLENQIFFLQSVRRRYIEGRSLFCLRALIVRINPSSSPSCFHSIIKVKVERKELPAAVLLHSFSTLISCLIG